MWYTKTATQQSIGKLYDCFGDSYTEESTVESLKEIFKNMNSEIVMNESDPEQFKEAIAKIENKYFPNHSSKFGLFRLVNAYLDIYEVVQDENTHLKYTNLDLSGIKIVWRRGLIHKRIYETTTHCILDKK